MKIHGDADTSVSIDEAHSLHIWNPKSELIIIDGADHVFGTKHPWVKTELSEALNKVVLSVISFINSNS